MPSPRRPARPRGFAGRKQIAGRGGTSDGEKFIGADEKLRKITRAPLANSAIRNFPCLPSTSSLRLTNRRSTTRSTRRARNSPPASISKASVAGIEDEKDTIILTAEDASRLRGLREIVIGKLSKRGVDLRNIDQKEPAISSIGHARQELKIQQGLEGDKAKEIILAIKGGGFKVQNQLQDRQIRVTGKKRDELQEVIAFVKSKDFGVATNFKNFRD